MKNNIKALRAKYELSQQALGEMIGRTKGQISKLENGHQDPSLHELDLLAKAFTKISQKDFAPWHLIADEEDFDKIVRDKKELAYLERRRNLSEEEQAGYDKMTEAFIETIRKIRND